MASNFEDYIPAKQAAEMIGISYELLMSRCYKGKVKYEKNGYAVFILREEVEREAREQRLRDNNKPKD